jgi:pheromone shutdown-related protein TraB
LIFIKLFFYYETENPEICRKLKRGFSTPIEIYMIRCHQIPTYRSGKTLFYDKFMNKSTENVILSKSQLSVSLITAGGNELFMSSNANETHDIDTKLDINSGLIEEPLPNSASVIFIAQSSIEHQAETPLSKIVLIGTAHVSEKSVTEVKSVIRNLKPDIVAVELCNGRYDSLKGNSQEESIPIKDLLSGGKIYYYLVHWLLAHLQKKFGEDTGVKPGAEMVLAMKEAEAIGAQVALIDRDIQITLQRFWGKMKFLEKIRMIGSLIGCVVQIGKGDDLNIDQMTEQDVVAELVSELRGIAPTAAQVLIDERDAYLAGNIIKAAAEGGNKTIVVVIGAGHKAGVINYLKNPKNIPPLDTLMKIPKKSLGIGKIVSTIFVGIIVAFFALLLLSGVSLQLFLIAFICWFIVTGVLSALGALLAGGHRNSVLTSFLIAWITTPHPGWFAGLVEAKHQNPKTSDIKALFAVENFGEIFKNRVMKILLVASLTNIGSLVGAVLGGFIIVHLTGIDPRDILFAGLRTLGF